MQGIGKNLPKISNDGEEKKTWKFSSFQNDCLHLMAVLFVLISFKRSYKMRSSYVRTRSFCTRTNSTIIHFTNNTFLQIFTTHEKKIPAKRDEKKTHKHYEWYQTFFVYIIWIAERSFDWRFVNIVSNATDTNSFVLLP